MKNPLITFLAMLLFAGVLTMPSYAQETSVPKSPHTQDGFMDNTELNIADMDVIPMIRIRHNNHSYYVADLTDSVQIYKSDVVRDSCFLVVSKHEYRVYVYEAIGGDTILAAHFPMCYGILPEAKEEEGDKKTPEASLDDPIYIHSIFPSWNMIFISETGAKSKPYGPYFHRLKLPDSNNMHIGIHGSSGSLRESIPGRGSHGCIRMRNEDVQTLHDLYSYKGMKVAIKPIDAKKLPFEKRAEQALGERYVQPKLGHPLSGKTKKKLP